MLTTAEYTTQYPIVSLVPHSVTYTVTDKQHNMHSLILQSSLFFSLCPCLLRSLSLTVSRPQRYLGTTVLCSPRSLKGKNGDPLEEVEDLIIISSGTTRKRQHSLDKGGSGAERKVAQGRRKAHGASSEFTRQHPEEKVWQPGAYATAG